MNRLNGRAECECEDCQEEQVETITITAKDAE